MEKVSKKIMALMLALTLVFSNFAGLGAGKVLADEENDYIIDKKEILVDEEIIIYSNTGKIKKDSTIEYETEDGESSVFESVEKNGDYNFIIEAIKLGSWKVKSLNGEEIENANLDFTVYGSEEELFANISTDLVEDVIEEETVTEESIEEETNSETITEEEIIPELSQEFSASNLFAKTSGTNASVNRFSGTDRFATAVEVSKENFSSSNNVVVTNGVDYPDALAAVTLAKQLRAPILFVKSNASPLSTREEIKRLNAKKAYVIGGEGSVNSVVFDSIKNTTGNAERISGRSRQETAIKVAEKTLSLSGKMDTVLLVAGDNYADALSAGPASGTGETPYPIIFTSKANSDNIDSMTKEFVNKNINRVMIVGGESSVSENAKKTFENLGKNVERISGKDRYDTSIKVAGRFFKTADAAYMASGENFADALAGGAVGAKDSNPMYLVRGAGVTSTLDTELKNKRISNANILGGTGSVSTDFENSLKLTLGIKTESSLRQKVVDEAMKHVGKPYVYGEAGPNSFDCSGFVLYVYKQATGMNLYHQAAKQAKYGKYVSRENLQPGDLIFFNGYSSSITHVGIYIGDGMMIDSPTYGQTVGTRSIYSNYHSKTYETSRNLLD